jgi:NarL family two-component system response regulator YdfI
VIRLAIAAPSAVVRAGLESLAASSPELQLVGSFPDVASADDLQPDVILASLTWDEIVTARDGGTAAIVLLTNESQPVWTVDALRRGARAVLPRDASQSEILAAVAAAANDLAVLDPRDLESLLAGAASLQTTNDGASALTPRELEVLRMMADGAANKIIAWKLGVSEHTAKFHVASILAKLGAASRTEAVTIGIRKGMVLL